MGWLTNEKNEKITCEQCGTEYETTKSTADDSETFCSKKCEKDFEENVSCEFCSEDYKPSKSGAENKERFCSLKCETEVLNDINYNITISIKDNDTTTNVESVNRKAMSQIKNDLITAITEKKDLVFIKNGTNEMIIRTEAILSIDIDEE
jgi:hypothetical protein